MDLLHRQQASDESGVPDMTPAAVLAARQSLGLTQAEFASWLGYPLAARVSELERGVRSPGAAVVLLIEAYLSGYRRKG